MDLVVNQSIIEFGFVVDLTIDENAVLLINYQIDQIYPLTQIFHHHH